VKLKSASSIINALTIFCFIMLTTSACDFFLQDDQESQESKGTKEQDIDGIIPIGTSLIGTDIEPGVYVSLAGDNWEDIETCYWERLSGLSGERVNIIANNKTSNLFYVEVLDSDLALSTTCELLPIENVPPPEEKYSKIESGMHLIGRDIDAGTWKGFAESECMWVRLSCATGSPVDCFLAADSTEGQFSVEIAPNDYAFKVSCPMEKVE